MPLSFMDRQESERELQHDDRHRRAHRARLERARLPRAVGSLRIEELLADVSEVLAPVTPADLEHRLRAVVVRVVGEVAPAAVVVSQVLHRVPHARRVVHVLAEAVKDASSRGRSREVAEVLHLCTEAIGEATVGLLSVPDVTLGLRDDPGIDLDPEIASGAQRESLADRDGRVATSEPREGAGQAFRIVVPTTGRAL